MEQNGAELHYCPVCDNNVRRFLPFGEPQRAHARCPCCGALERHRLDWIFLAQRTNLFDRQHKKMLHVAPEAFLVARFRNIEGIDYLSADLNDPSAMERMDLTDIHHPDDSFQVIYCSHVLEHIPNDRKALAELYRVLSLGGWAMLQVPITAEQTYEDPTIVTPEARQRHFGQWDHVRLCGPDYADRMRDAGFVVEVLPATDVVAAAECTRMGIQTDRYIFFCRKHIMEER